MWRYGGADPYRAHHLLDEGYVPLEGGGDPRRPPYPSRVKKVMVGFARFSFVHEVRLHGGQVETLVTKRDKELQVEAKRGVRGGQ